MFSQHKTDSVTRSVSSRTLDGRKLTADVTIVLHRAMGRSDAEALATQVAGIVDDILGAQIILGQAPLTAADLEAMTLAKAKGLGKVANVRISSLRLSVPPPGQVPSVRAPPTKAHSNRPGSVSPAPGVDGPVPGTPSRSQSPLPGTRLAPPRSQSPLPGTPLRSPSPPPSGSRPAVHSSSPPSGSRPAVQSSPPPLVRSPSPPPSIAPNVDGFGAALALPLRDTAARAVISVLSVVTSAQVDRLSFLEGSARARELCREVCACFAASIYRTAISRGESHKLAAAKVEAVCKHAFPDESSPSATEIGFYIAMDTPTIELANRIATYLGCEGDVHLLRAAVTSCHTAFGERLGILQERMP